MEVFFKLHYDYNIAFARLTFRPLIFCLYHYYKELLLWTRVCVYIYIYIKVKIITFILNKKVKII